MKKILSFIAIFALFLGTFTTSAFAANVSNAPTEENISSTTVFAVGEDVSLTRQANGNYVGTFEVVDPRNAISTTITATLTGNVASIPNKYVLDFHWAGTAQVGTISASTITVKSTSLLFPDQYFYKENYSTACGGATMGSRAAGTFIIPEDVSTVRLKTTNLTAYFLQGAAWVSSPSINTTFDVN